MTNGKQLLEEAVKNTHTHTHTCVTGVHVSVIKLSVLQASFYRWKDRLRYNGAGLAPRHHH